MIVDECLACGKIRKLKKCGLCERCIPTKLAVLEPLNVSAPAWILPQRIDDIDRSRCPAALKERLGIKPSTSAS